MVQNNETRNNFDEYKKLIDCKIEEYQKFLDDFGGKSRGNVRYITRNNAYDKQNNTFKHNNEKAYFGWINKGDNDDINIVSSNNEDSGPYSDLSIVIMPSHNVDKKRHHIWAVSLGLGSKKYMQDAEIASLPGLRRMFCRYLEEYKNCSYIKSDFTDYNSKNGFKKFLDKQNANLIQNEETIEELNSAFKDYESLIFACTLFDPLNEEGSKIVKKYLALYARFVRQWCMDKTFKKEISYSHKYNENIEQENITNLLKTRRYVVLQGAPGTGKTRMAKKIAEENNGIVFFTQFHAETTYSDFIYGIMPKINSDKLEYEDKKGIFVEAINMALDNITVAQGKNDQEKEKNAKKVYLIVDEINRANLSNVLGEAFYLFEPNMEDSNVEIKISGVEKPLKRLPKNLYVIATMNTADRSLAIVDFALRRRFAWYTMKPHELPEGLENNKVFRKKEFNDISEIFEKYATDEELNLQPGHAYFIVNKENAENEIKDRLRYELMPLIKEYLLDGMLSRAKDDFVNYFRERIEEEMFE